MEFGKKRSLLLHLAWIPQALYKLCTLSHTSRSTARARKIRLRVRSKTVVPKLLKAILKTLSSPSAEILLVRKPSRWGKKDLIRLCLGIESETPGRRRVTRKGELALSSLSSRFDLPTAQTWFTDSAPSLPTALTKFNVVHSQAVKQHSVGRARGGIPIGINEAFNYTLLDISPWWICIKIQLDNISLGLCTVYFSPAQDLYYHLSLLQYMLNDVQENHHLDLLILGGDFNARVGLGNDFPSIMTEGSTLLPDRTSLDTTVNSRGTQLLDFADINGFVLLNGRTHGDIPAKYTFCSAKGKSVIDQVWVNLAGINFISQLRVLDIPSQSDHSPISLQLSLPSLFLPPRTSLSHISTGTKVKWLIDKKDTFNNAMRWSQKISIDFDKEDIDFINRNLIEAILDAAETTGLVKTYNRHTRSSEHKSCFDKDCLIAKKRLRAVLRIAKAASFDLSSLSEYISAKKDYKDILKNKTKNYQDLIIKEFADVKNTTQFWRTYNSYRRKNAYTLPLPVDTWNKVYEGIYPPRIVDNSLYFGVLDPVLDTAITFEEITCSISHLKNCKASGLDSIPGELYKNLPCNWLLYVQTLFNKILDKEIVPKDWAHVALVMLHKKGDQHDPSNYRSLAMINLITKIFTMIIK
ncbi:Protein of unknown function [Cotesia congregata]|uniref:Endonuclease/exonuclease/phosphatase domain-containing protein n=1 Tax=Cotesia congregata TaxID=51543 RepID=A0A8J2ME75_COTCN|nr:Protein of unknown function [Cotesia congregata]